MTSHEPNYTSLNHGSVFEDELFHRFDIEGDEETQMNFTQPEEAQIPSTLVPSPPRQEAHQRKNVLIRLSF